MIHQTGHHVRSSFFTQAARQTASLGIYLAIATPIGCTRAEVSLGAGEAGLEAGGGPCGDGVVVGDVTAADQEAIEALRGCREVTGDLTVFGFPEMDLTPLSELRIVRGSMSLGSTSPETFIPSLEGLESLEQVNSLTLSHLLVEDLSALASLRRVALDPLGPSILGGSLTLVDCDRLRDLRGLEGLTDLSGLSLRGNANLQSLAGLRVPRTLRSVSAVGTGALKDLSALAPLRTLDSLSLQHTSLENLDGLQLDSIDRVSLVDNEQLQQVDSLSSLRALRSLTIANNDDLQALPNLSEIGGASEVVIVGNAELRAMPALPLRSTTSFTVGARAAATEGVSSNESLGFELFEVGENPKLESVANIDFAEAGSHVAIYGNASLTRIDLWGLSHLSSLQLVANPALSDVWLLHLEQVAELEIRDNPLLSLAEFSAVQTFDSQISGNLDSPARTTEP